MAVRTHVRCHGRDQRLTLHPGGPPCGDRCFSGRMINQQEPTVDLRWVLKRWGPMPGTSRREPRPAATRRERVRTCRHGVVDSGTSGRTVVAFRDPSRRRSSVGQRLAHIDSPWADLCDEVSQFVF